MANETLLAGDLARRNREMGFCGDHSNHRSPLADGLGLHQRNDRDGTSQETETETESESQQLCTGYHVALSSSDAAPDSNELTGNPAKSRMQFSIPSSMDTTLNASQKGRQERNIVVRSLAQESSSNGVSTTRRNGNPWTSALQVRPDAAPPHDLPIFASWTDL
ncbi:hypothetical protein SAY87_017144 [Trapa incisa]|uniref:Uncharacterized protein n=1 Tax=Trapa incisa TaxID=236973 RepID=A0AAN7QZQ7_9MYRT|nr:hypothetical protein SAY87_017144 [Trapa incisa]